MFDLFDILLIKLFDSDLVGLGELGHFYFQTLLFLQIFFAHILHLLFHILHMSLSFLYFLLIICPCVTNLLV